MLEDIKKGLLAGFGTIFLTKDKIEEATKKLVDQAKLSRWTARLKTSTWPTGSPCAGPVG